MNPTAPQLDPAAPRVLLFGHAGSGKSSLLGALLRAGETQGDALNAEVIDPTRTLDQFRDHVYHNAPLDEPDAELVTHTVRLRPWRIDSRPMFDPFNVVLLDCDGGAAQSLFKHPAPLTQPEGRGAIAQAVVEADAIILAVDARSDAEQLDAAFEDFDTFLTVIGRAKIEAREVGGFPIYLVLTRCDLLAKKDDTTAKWETRVAERMEAAQERFLHFLGDEDADGVRSPFLPFGSIELSVSAVAVRRPSLADDPSPPNQPYHVAELFRTCLASAKEHHDRVVASNRRLKWTVRAAVAAVGCLLIGLGGLMFFAPHRGDPGLADRVQAYERFEPPAATRLAEVNIGRNKRVLTAFQADARFGALPEEMRDFVYRRLKEIDDYQAYRAKMANTTSPAGSRSLDELGRVETHLTNELALPPEYAWGDTEAARLRGKWLADIPLIRDAEARWHDHFRDLVRRGTTLTLAPSFDGNWTGDVDTVFAAAGMLPFDPSATIPGSPEVQQPRGDPVAYRVPFEFDRVYQARRDWDFARERLTHLRDLADALGMTGGPNRPPPVLSLPEPGPAANSATLPGAVLTAIRRAYPRPSEGFPEWEVRNFPEPGRGELTRRLQRSFGHGARHVQKLVLVKMGAPPEARDNPAGWREIADALNEEAFRDWGRVLHLLIRLQDPAAPNPVDAFAAFLRTDSFALDLRGFELAIPVDLREQRVTPTGPLAVTVVPRAGPPVTLNLKVGEGVRRDGNHVYAVTADGDAKLTYRAGELLTAELPVRAGAQEMKLVWGAAGTDTFQFDRLSREPRLTRGGATEPAAGVRLTPTAGTALPRLPPLMPDVRR